MRSTEYFEVEGGRPLSGAITPQGAKNEALQILAATLLTPEEVVISNVPQILDVIRMMALLAYLGVDVRQISDDTYAFKAEKIDPERLLTPQGAAMMQGLRGSVLVVGPLLARCGYAYLFKPGGDKIGRRRLDTHFAGFQKLGATWTYDDQYGCFALKAARLKGGFMLLDEASVTGTGNIVMAAALARGATTIYHAACEPYIQQLCALLNRMGARISGVASNLLYIEGVENLAGGEHRLLADMIEVGSFIGLAAMTRSRLTIRNADAEHLGVIPDTFRRLGVRVEADGNDLIADGSDVCEVESFIDGSILTLSDHPWPGLTPDLISVLLVVATQCRGTVLIHQKMFESRLFFVDKLIDMGAKIILCDPHRATVVGLERAVRLRAISMTSPDIRAGVALLLAAMSADGVSRIHNIEQIDRGYQFIDTRLNALGASVQRVVMDG